VSDIQLYDLPSDDYNFIDLNNELIYAQENLSIESIQKNKELMYIRLKNPYEEI
jgi:hypothetical protein